MRIDFFQNTLRECSEAQHEATELWHKKDDGRPIAPDPGAHDANSLRAFVLAQHYCNFCLWHVEDIARRRDVGPQVIADCKHKVDSLNQERNDLMERVDGCFIALLAQHLPDNAQKRYNTESLGMAMDRLSILSLKIWHMQEQTLRDDANPQHIANCNDKLKVLCEQRNDLEQSLYDLIEEFIQGKKQPKLYFQFKMYNDPDLNPEIYKNAKGKPKCRHMKL